MSTPSAPWRPHIRQECWWSLIPDYYQQVKQFNAVSSHPICDSPISQGSKAVWSVCTPLKMTFWVWFFPPITFFPFNLLLLLLLLESSLLRGTLNTLIGWASNTLEGGTLSTWCITQWTANRFPKFSLFSLLCPLTLCLVVDLGNVSFILNVHLTFKILQMVWYKQCDTSDRN